jgi:4-hydroxy-tetrahydrodipicolinate synthase
MKLSLESFSGVIVPMITPFTSKGKLDMESAALIMNHLHINNTIPFVLGTTGEAASIPLKEREELVKILVENRRNRIPAISGVTGANLKEIIIQANKYIKFGADAVVITPPCHFELSGNQMLKYYEDLSDNIEGNIIMYNIPKTVHQSIPIDVADELSGRSNIIGIKDSENNSERLKKSLNLWKDRRDFYHFIGTNALMLEGLLSGSKGIVPSTANFLPGLYVELYRLCRHNYREEAEETYLRTVNWSAFYQEGKTLGESLAGLKVIMAEIGFCQPNVLPPLTQLDDKEKVRIVTMIRKCLSEDREKNDFKLNCKTK